MSWNVVFWNIESGQSNKAIPGNPLEKNLKQIIETTDGLDALVLAEFKPGCLSNELQRKLTCFGSSLFFPYSNQSPQLGIAVFSPHRIRAMKQELLDWKSKPTKSRWMGIDLAKSPNHHHFTRQFISLQLTKKDGESIEIIPFHFMHPWEDVRVFGPLAIPIIGSSLFIGTPSPFRTQVKRFIKMLTDQVQGKSNPILVFGDSNSPDRWLNIPSYWWRKISKLAHPIFQRSPTFPAPGSSYSRKYPSMRLDQAFAINLKGNQKAEVLSMQGSDHFPLKIVAF